MTGNFLKGEIWTQLHSKKPSEDIGGKVEVIKSYERRWKILFLVPSTGT